ncbi:MAG: GNAT family N-acetyltransferase [Alphaproteobacteria bacterium]
MAPQILTKTVARSLSLPGETVFRPRIAGPANAPALIRHYARLGDFDRYTRFFSAMSDDGLQNYVAAFDWTRMIAVCVYSDEELVGVAELGWEERGKPERAELGVSIDAGFRRRGLASWLISELFVAGRQAGVEHVYASWVGGNDAVGRIMRSHGASIWLSGNHWQGELRLPDIPATAVADFLPRHASGAQHIS